MDLLTHAAVGAATGLPFGRPILGAFAAVVPDLVLGPWRKAAPTPLYDCTHSLWFVAFGGIAACAAGPGVGAVVALALLSHLVLDLPTHGPDWAPPLLLPYSKRRFSFGKEWEFFNSSWYIGLNIATIWSSLCLFATVL